jgi:hypothetical protein
MHSSLLAHDAHPAGRARTETLSQSYRQTTVNGRILFTSAPVIHLGPVNAIGDAG